MKGAFSLNNLLLGTVRPPVNCRKRQLCRPFPATKLLLNTAGIVEIFV